MRMLATFRPSQHVMIDWRVANISATMELLQTCCRGIWRITRQMGKEDKNDLVCCGKLNVEVAGILVTSYQDVVHVGHVHDDATRKLLSWNLGLMEFYLENLCVCMDIYRHVGVFVLLISNIHTMLTLAILRCTERGDCRYPAVICTA